MIKRVFTLILLFKTIVLYAQNIETFDYSICLSEVNVCEYTKAEIIEETKDQNYYEVKFTAYNNCIGDFESQVLSPDDSTINVVIFIKGLLTKDEIEVALCDCLFEFKMRLSNINGLTVKRLLINGESFDKHNDRYNPIVEQIDSLVFDNLPEEFYDSDSVFTITDKRPELLINYDSLITLVNDKIIDKEFEQDKKTGSVFIEFIIGKDGSVIKSELVKGVNKQIDKLVYQTISELNLRFRAAEIHETPVQSRLIIPIKIKTRANN